ncbi:GNAT family N-acetyltransferase [Candidatus Desulfarcum epimagneticum]|uniref:GNAT family N-acetyltransferase n=1 Tax=uncultured Desulfobacteraceae bacterium TaxID=218296 RepID=A0A484HBW3_9BACT|nr:GNAT family N-acetyltransferase [uncultured Desulfobacteraceae bacterium]
MLIIIKELKSPTPKQREEIAAIYLENGWWDEKNENPDLVSGIVSGSHCFVIAEFQGRIVGMGRAISDGASDAYIQDMAVQSGFKRKGVGTQILKKITSRIQSDGIGWIGLIAEKGSSRFYSGQGFEIFRDASPMLLKK